MNHPAELSGKENDHINSNAIQNKYGPCVTIVESDEIDCSDILESIDLYTEKLTELRQEKVDNMQALSTHRKVKDNILQVRSKFETISNKVNKTEAENQFMERAKGISFL